MYTQVACTRRDISGNTGSNAAFDAAFRWFKQCNRHHAACSATRTAEANRPPILPTRVINFAQKDGLRLEEPGGARGRYLCLSHRWLAPEIMPRCTTDNLPSLKQCIPWEYLTQTFRDAISFAREFSQRYSDEYPGEDPIQHIWIDSFCIIQDSTEDWRREAARMCDIYANGILTVAAGTGRDGCFVRADSKHVGFEVTNPRRRSERLFLRDELPHFGLGVKMLEEVTRLDTLDLLTRGWVLQERILSRRFLVFGPQEMMWECLESVDCECEALQLQYGAHSEVPSSDGADTPLSLPAESRVGGRHLVYEMVDPFVRQHGPSEMLPLKIASHMTLEEARLASKLNPLERTGVDVHKQLWWYRLVQDFTSLQLTFHTDRLPAIAGLATEFAKGAQPRSYMAGIWKSSLLEDLLWARDTEREVFERRKRLAAGQKSNGAPSNRATAAPSWSWASCAGPVMFVRRSFRVDWDLATSPRDTSNPVTCIYAKVCPSEEAAGIGDCEDFGKRDWPPLKLSGDVFAGLRSDFQQLRNADPPTHIQYFPDRQPDDGEGDEGSEVAGSVDRYSDLALKDNDLLSGKDHFMLMLRHKELENSGPRIGKAIWIMIHLQPSADNGPARRRGILWLERPLLRSAVLDTDAMMKDCFASREWQDVQLI
jgi:hypothetical protein